MLSAYKGPANSQEVFQHLVGERIVAAFQDSGGEYGLHTYFVTESGHAFVMNGNGAYWVESAEKVQRIVNRRRRDIEQKIAELKNMAGVDIGG